MEERLRRSRIYIPGNNPRMLQKGPLFDADAVILDLEDAVSPEEKDAARMLVARTIQTLDFMGSEIMVRINPLSTEYGEDDLRAVIPAHPDSIVLPKTDCAEDVILAEEIIADIQSGMETTWPVSILPLIETARGVMNAYEIATASDSISAVTFGGEDYTRDLGATRTKKGMEIFYARSRIVMAAKAARVQALDTVFSDVKDMDGLREDTRLIKEMGFDGKAAIHPAQVEVIHDVFAPDRGEIEYSLDVIKAAEEARSRGSGVAVIKGKMIDVPVIHRARKIIKTARVLGLLDEEDNIITEDV